MLTVPTKGTAEMSLFVYLKQ